MFDDREMGWALVVLGAGCPTPAACPGAAPEPGAAGTAGTTGTAGGCPVAGLLAELASMAPSAGLLAVLASVPTDRLSGAELVLLLRALGRGQSWLATIVEDTLLAVDARAQAGADAATQELIDRGVDLGRGALLPDAGREEIALALHVSPLSAQSKLMFARDCRNPVRHPGLAGLLGTGRTSPAHARALFGALDGLTDEQAAQVSTHPRVLRALTDRVPWQVGTTATALAAAHRDPGDATDAHTQARDRRGVVAGTLADGMAEVVATLPAADAAAVMARLNHAVRQATHVGDPRTADQVRADTLAALGWHGRPDRAGPAAAAATIDVLPAAGPAGPAGSPAASRSCPWCAGGPVDPCQAAWAGRVIARVQVTIGIDTLLALTDDPARVSTDGRSAGSTDWGWTPAGTARELLAQPGTEWQRFLHDQTGLLLGVSRAHPIPEPLRRLALARYTRCTFPGCTSTHSREQTRTGADLDHALPWQPDRPGQPLGPALTHPGNLHPADRRHHQLHTHFGWTPTIDPHTATVTWTSPLQQTTTTDPDRWAPDGWDTILQASGTGAQPPPPPAPPPAAPDHHDPPF